MIKVFLNQDPRMQARCGQSAVDDRCRHWRGGDGFTGAAGILRADVTMDEETRRFDVELFADVFSDLDQIAPALATGARFRFVAMLNARQLWRQGIATAAFVRARCIGGFLLLLQFGDDGGAIFVAGLDKQIALFGR